MSQKNEDSNVAMVCSDCAPKPGQFTGQNPDTFVDKFVKLGFVAKRDDGSDTKEHMWVKVQKVEAGDYLLGILHNHPVMWVAFSYGDEVGFHVSEIEQVAEDTTTPVNNEN